MADEIQFKKVKYTVTATTNPNFALYADGVRRTGCGYPGKRSPTGTAAHQCANAMKRREGKIYARND